MAASARADVPGPGRLLGTSAEHLALNFRRAAAVLLPYAGERASDAYNYLFAPRDVSLGTPATPHDLRVPWALLGMWATATVVRGKGVSLHESEEWFLEQPSRLSARFPLATRHQAEASLDGIDVGQLRALLPYVIDPHGPGTRRSVIRDPAQEPVRGVKRRQGIYYTPGDVADYMTSLAVHRSDEAVLDPACGTGVFLRAALRHRNVEGLARSLEAAYGVDIDPLAIDGACFVLTAASRELGSGTPWCLWHIARLNLAQRDALTLLVADAALGSSVDLTAIASARSDLRTAIVSGSVPAPTKLERTEWGESFFSLFPEADGFAVVGNPPYAPTGHRPDLGRLGELSVLRGSNVTPSTNSFIPFLEFMWSVSKSRHASALVVPMSIAYNTTSPFGTARRAIEASGGEWSFRFYDRTPDSLFGDDIKQRVAIVSRQPEERFELLTTGLIRWTSRQRGQLFATGEKPVSLGSTGIAAGIPKIGTVWERDTYASVRARRERLANTLADATPRSEVGPAEVHVGATAYNRLVIYRDGAHSQSVTKSRLVANTDAEADWAYALLVSTIVYWLWRVEGDGFHVSAPWVLGLPFAWRGDPADRGLSAEGRAAWEEAQRHPVVAVNSGRTTVSYQPNAARVRVVDSLVLRLLAVDADLLDRFHAFRRDTINVGRGDDSGT